MALCGPKLLAQATAPPTDEAPPPGLYTLKVYANLAQVPTLIISPDQKPFPPLTPDKFFVSLDGGPPFHPPQLRIEGDDAISLAIVLDASGDQTHFMDGIADMLSTLAVKDLHPKDRVSIYAMDCNAIQSVDNAPASPELIRKAVESVLAAPTLHGQKKKAACTGSVHLWDIIAHAVDKLGETPSRRVALVFSLGMESGSVTTLEQLEHLAQHNSVAVFGMRDVDEYMFQRRYRDLSSRALAGDNNRMYPEDRLSTLAATTGGMVFDNHHIQIQTQLHLFITMLRSRYIVEFPRPDNSAPGSHLIAITVPSHSNYLVRYTGASIPLPNPDVLKDPNTVPSAPSPATFGNRRPTQPKP
jgi:hypothetical protein